MRSQLLKAAFYCRGIVDTKFSKVFLLNILSFEPNCHTWTSRHDFCASTVRFKDEASIASDKLLKESTRILF
jgi:hypothetical protein